MSYYQNSDTANAKKNNDLALKYDNSLKMAKILDVKLALDEPSFDIQSIQTKLKNLKIQLQTDKNLLADVHIIEANMNLKLNKEQDGIKAYDEAYNSIKAKDGLEVKKSFILYALSMLKDDERIGTQAIILDNQSKNYRYDVGYYVEIARLMNKKGFELYHKGGYDKALEYYQKTLAINEKVLGKEHQYTATSYNNIGSVYKSMGDYPKALEYHQKSLAICEKVLGKEHSDTATSYNNIGLVYNSMGDYSKALEYYQKSLAIVEKVST
jgi:tetratricopeptide (TPR) repeat protein